MSFVNSEFKHSEITGIIIVSAIEVYNELGMGFPEKIYQPSLEIELSEHPLKLNREYTNPVHFKGKLVGRRRLDFVIDTKL